MEQIVKHFTDNDLYTFTVQYYILQQYPKAEVRYSFFDRNFTHYPEGFGELLREQVNNMKDVVITDEEINFMRRKCYFLPEWYFTFLKGYRFNPSEVNIFQDSAGHLNITIEGKWFSTVMWEMPILSTISELMHKLNGDTKKIDLIDEYKRAYAKAEMLLENGVNVSEMGTRRRFSFDLQDTVIRTFVDYNEKLTEGRFLGTSNVYFAMKYNLTPIGTMSHQIISFEENVSGVHECNFAVMNKWAEVYDGNLGIYLYDCFGDNIFFDNITTKHAKLFDGLRVDSGVNEEQLEKIIEMYKKLHLDPKHHSVIFSNALNGKTAIEIHKAVKRRMEDSCGMGTWLTCNFDEISGVPSVDIDASNIVIKLVAMRYTPQRKWLDCVKLSCDKGKTLGNREKCEYLSKIIM